MRKTMVVASWLFAGFVLPQAELIAQDVDRSGMQGAPLRMQVGSEAEYLWFQDVLVRVGVAFGDGADSISVLEFSARPGASTPLHVHNTHDEIFHVLEGEVTWHIADKDLTVGPGNTLLAPKKIPHYYRVTSPRGARWLAITSGPDFEGFVRALARPAETPDLPPPMGPLPPEAMEALKRAAWAHGIKVLGPPSR
jgi:quercetin dioxygenase-like cupin family protein